MFVCLSVRLYGLITLVLDIWPDFGCQALRKRFLRVSSKHFERRFLADSGIEFMYKLIKKMHQI